MSKRRLRRSSDYFAEILETPSGLFFGVALLLVVAPVIVLLVGVTFFAALVRMVATPLSRKQDLDYLTAMRAQVLKHGVDQYTLEELCRERNIAAWKIWAFRYT